MQYKIPRYIDYQAKIFGPANFKQFVFLLVGMITIGFIWLLIDNLFVFFFLALLIGAITITLAFGKVAGQPVVTMLSKFINFRLSGPKTYFWKKKEIQPRVIQRKELEDQKEKEEDGISLSKGRSKLDSISKKIETS